jgi:Cache 3/Cache 2 fusion domain
MSSIPLRSVKTAHAIGICVLAFGFLATTVLVPSVGNAQDARVAKSMAALKDQTAKLGAPKVDGKDVVGGRDAPALYFGSTKMNNNFSVVDAVAEEGGRGTAATLFVKSGDDYIRVATSVSTRKGSGRGIGTVLSGAPLNSSKQAMHITVRRLFLGRPISAAMSRSRTHRVRLSVFISSATRSDAAD